MTNATATKNWQPNAEAMLIGMVTGQREKGLISELQEKQLLGLLELHVPKDAVIANYGDKEVV